MLYASLVQSTEAHAKIVSIDWSEALNDPEVVDYACVTDIPDGGTNQPATRKKFNYDNTKIFADKEVIFDFALLCF